jgi:hypothetical protein
VAEAAAAPVEAAPALLQSKPHQSKQRQLLLHRPHLRQSSKLSTLHRPWLLKPRQWWKLHRAGTSTGSSACSGSCSGG